MLVLHRGVLIRVRLWVVGLVDVSVGGNGDDGAFDSSDLAEAKVVDGDDFGGRGFLARRGGSDIVGVCGGDRRGVIGRRGGRMEFSLGTGFWGELFGFTFCTRHGGRTR
jgi:hypothetical protein